MSRGPYAGPRKLLIAFDVGTTHSGISYSILEPGKVPDIRSVHKFPGQKLAGGRARVPSVLYYSSNGRVCAAGAETERDAIEIIAEVKEWKRAERFTLHLHPETILSMTESTCVPTLPLSKTAVEVLSDFLRYLKDCAKQYIQEIHPETGKGDGVIIVDTREGALDIGVYAFENDGRSFKEIAESRSYLKGSTFVTGAVEEYLEKLLEGSRFHAKIPAMKHSFYHTIQSTFRDSKKPHYIQFGSVRDKDVELGIVLGQLCLNGEVIASFFEPSVKCIIGGVLDQHRIAHKSISTVFLVGDFSTSDYIFERVKKGLGLFDLQVFRPGTQMDNVIADGALSSFLNHWYSVGAPAAHTSSYPTVPPIKSTTDTPRGTRNFFVGTQREPYKGENGPSARIPRQPARPDTVERTSTDHRRSVFGHTGFGSAKKEDAAEIVMRQRSGRRNPQTASVQTYSTFEPASSTRQRHDGPTPQIYEEMLVEGPGDRIDEDNGLELDTHIPKLAGGRAISSNRSAPVPAISTKSGSSPLQPQVSSPPSTPSKHFDKLTNENYHEWKIYMTAVLVKKGLLGIVDGTEGPPGSVEGTKKVKRFHDRKARARAELILHVSPSQLIHCSHEDPAVIWTTLAVAHAGYRRSTINSLRSQLYQLRLGRSETMSAFVGRARYMASLIKEAGGKTSDDDIIIPITTGLPSSYDSCIASFDTLPDSRYNLDTIITELISEYERQTAAPHLIQETHMPHAPSM